MIRELAFGAALLTLVGCGSTSTPMASAQTAVQKALPYAQAVVTSMSNALPVILASQGVAGTSTATQLQADVAAAQTALTALQSGTVTDPATAINAAASDFVQLALADPSITPEAKLAVAGLSGLVPLLTAQMQPAAKTPAN
jgi:hypothetical protein